MKRPPKGPTTTGQGQTRTGHDSNSKKSLKKMERVLAWLAMDLLRGNQNFFILSSPFLAVVATSLSVSFFLSWRFIHVSQRSKLLHSLFWSFLVTGFVFGLLAEASWGSRIFFLTRQLGSKTKEEKLLHAWGPHLLVATSLAPPLRGDYQLFVEVGDPEFFPLHLQYALLPMRARPQANRLLYFGSAPPVFDPATGLLLHHGGRRTGLILLFQLGPYLSWFIQHSP